MPFLLYFIVAVPLAKSRTQFEAYFEDSLLAWFFLNKERTPKIKNEWVIFFIFEKYEK
jgi:hypothetical protein